jgi:8-oxo-dGTP pyrophosphatase MutT (NUDIX family)
MHPGPMKVLATNLSMSEPSMSDLKMAAVAVILDRDASNVLMIRRSDHEGDPWSGQVAFPGGKAQQGDRNVRTTAARETLEEVGIDLAGASDFLGYGAPLITHTGTMKVVPVAFRLKGDVLVSPNPEVASHRWVGLRQLTSSHARASHLLTMDGGSAEVPAIQVEDYLVWGLTYRIVISLFSESSG